MQAIVTKYLGATNVRGSRVKATAQAGSLTMHWDDALNSDANHRKAALNLAAKLRWSGVWISGGLPSGESVWVCDPQDARDTFTIPAEVA
jgi:hypothetical protein